MSELTTWDEFREMAVQAYNLAANAYEGVSDNLMCGGERRQALYDLSAGMREARENLKRLAELAIRLAPPEPPARPLEAVLADIEALGHYYEIRGCGYIGRDVVAVGSRLVGTDGFKGSTHADLLSWTGETEDGEARDADVAKAAEARLEQIRKLREQQRQAVVALVETLSYRPAVHFNPDRKPFTAACSDELVGMAFTDEPSCVTCPACQEWIAKNVDLSPEDLDAFMAAVEEAEARPETRWNVWSKADDGLGWLVVSSNLNEDQARASIERRSRRTTGMLFEALPIGQVPGQPPVTEADRLVFLNPDPEEAALARADSERVTAASEGEE